MTKHTQCGGAEVRGLFSVALKRCAQYRLTSGLAALDLLEGLDARPTQVLVARWQPYARMAYFHILLKRLEDAGQFDSQRACTGEV